MKTVSKTIDGNRPSKNFHKSETVHQKLNFHIMEMVGQKYVKMETVHPPTFTILDLLQQIFEWMFLGLTFSRQIPNWLFCWGKLGLIWDPD